MKPTTPNEYNLRILDRSLLVKSGAVNGRYKRLVGRYREWSAEVWTDCSTFVEFTHRTGFAESRCKKLDAEFARIFGRKPLFKPKRPLSGGAFAKLAKGF